MTSSGFSGCRDWGPVTENGEAGSTKVSELRVLGAKLEEAGVVEGPGTGSLF